MFRPKGPPSPEPQTVVLIAVTRTASPYRAIACEHEGPGSSARPDLHGQLTMDCRCRRVGRARS